MKTVSGLILAAAFLLGGCAGMDHAAPPPLQMSGEANPALWLLSDEDTDIYLFGTVHYLPPGLSWFDENVRDAFDRSDTIVLEMLTPPVEELAAMTFAMGLAEDGISLRDRLDEADAEKYRALLVRLKLPPGALDNYEPWLAFMSLYQMLLSKSAYDPAMGAEAVLTAQALNSSKPMIGLETAREQLAIFDDLPEEEQLGLLRSLLEDPDAVVAQVDQIVAYWSAGDVKGMDAYLKASSSDTPVERSLITARNANWTDWLSGRLETPGTVFVAVGAAHLTGPNNVRDMLDDRGLSTRRIDY